MVKTVNFMSCDFATIKRKKTLSNVDLLNEWLKPFHAKEVPNSKMYQGRFPLFTPKYVPI